MKTKSHGFAVDPEDFRCIGVQNALGDKIGDSYPILECRIDGNEGIGPEVILPIDLIDTFANVSGPYLRERASESLIVAKQFAVEIENIHGPVSPAMIT
jgi:hypothetical protein